MKFVIDIDGTICTSHEGQYEKAQPYIERINRINKLFDNGDIIVLFTARGMRTYGNKELAEYFFREVTLIQLKNWEVKYHELIFGKPAADYYIDDKGMNPNEFF